MLAVQPSTRLGQPPTFEGALAKAIGWKQPVFNSAKNQMAKFGAATQKFDKLSYALQAAVRRHCGCDLALPSIEKADHETASLDPDALYVALDGRLQRAFEALHDALAPPALGRIHWSGDETCRFTYGETKTQTTLLRVNKEVTQHVHDLVGAKAFALPAEHVPRPKFVDELIATCPAELRPHLRIVAGLEILKNHAVVASSSDWRPYVKTTFGVASKAAGAAVAAAGLLATFAAVAAKMAAVGVQVAVADPALVLGDVVFAGWELA